MRLDDGLGAVPSRTIWRFFPWFLALGMSVVVAVNGGMIYAALHSFPGKTGNDGFFMSNHYNQVIDRVAEQSALGWSMKAEADPAGHPLIALADRTGAPLTGGAVRAVVERLVGDPLTQTIAFVEVAPGQYLGKTPLTVKGQWQLQVTAAVAGHDIALTRRLVAR